MRTYLFIIFILFTKIVSAQSNYCTPVSRYNCNFNINISNVTFNTINRSSQCDGNGVDGYSFYNTSPNTTTVLKGSSYLLSVKTGPSYVEGAAAWIDYNQNMVFESNEMLFTDLQYTIPATYTRKVTIPSQALTGQTRLRIRAAYYSNPGNTPCDTVYYGETEDYLITIDSASCTPLNLTITGNTTDCDSVKLIASGGTSYLWNGGNTPNLSANTFYTSGTYGVQVTNSTGCTSAEIKNVIVNVKPGVTITVSPSDKVCSGSFVSFTANTVNAGLSPTYKWKRNGATISNATSSIYTTDSLKNNEVITCVISNSCYADTSNTITMSVVSTPQLPDISILASPSDTITAGTYVSFTASTVLAGISPIYQWKLNGVNVGTNSPYYTNSGLGNNDVVICILTSNATCVTRQTDTSNAIKMTVEYCMPTSAYSCQYDIIISNVTFNTIKRSSGCDGITAGYYSFYNTAPNTTTVHRDNSYLLSVKTGAYNDQGVVAWIDYNHNHVFEANEMIFSGYSSTIPATYNAKITIPSNALSGSTRLRVRSVYHTNPGNIPCGNVTYGETEDYLITIDSLTCSPPTLTITGDTTGCDSVVLTAGGGNSYLWSNGSTPDKQTNTFHTSGVYGVQTTASSGCATAAIRAVIIHQNIKPDITLYVYPGNNICSHTSVSFYTNYSEAGDFPIFTWKKNGVTISGVTSDYYNTDSLTNNDTITYILDNGCQADTSKAIIMSVADSASSPTVTITASPSDTITAGASVTFTATTTLGGTSPAYQWRVNGMNTGTNSSSYTISGLGNNDVVTCILTSNATCITNTKDTSNAITMTVGYCIPTVSYSCNINSMTITNVSFNTINRTSSCDNNSSYSYHNTAPNTTTLHKGNGYTLSVSTGSSYYQGVAAWIDYNHNNVFETNEAVLTGFNGNYGAVYSTNVTIPGTALTGATRLRVRSAYASNPVGYSCGNLSYGETEDYLITIDSVTCAPPTITIAGDTTGCDSVKLTASGGVSYLWNRGSSTSNALNTFYKTGPYSVQVTNTAGCSAAASGNVFIDPKIKPTITIAVNPSNSVCAGTSVTFISAVVNGGSYRNYQWRSNGVNIADATGSSFTTNTLTNNTVITCVITNACSSDTSDTIIMSVADSASSPTVTITATPSDTITAGATVTFSAATTLGGNSPAYQWRVNGIIAGTNSSSYTTTSLGNNDVVTCILTSNATCITTLKDTSNSIVMVVNYCTPKTTYSCNYDMVISKVMFNNFTRNSGCDGSGNGGYSYFDSASYTTVSKGNSYLLSVKTGSTYIQGVAAWIDYNQNKVFESNEMILSGLSYSIPSEYANKVLIPLSAQSGKTRLRVRTIYYSNPANNSCGNSTYGETEDYLIAIDSLTCTPPALSIAGDSTGCDSVVLTASGGNSYIWSEGSTPNKPTNTFYTSGLYGVQATASSGCAAAAIRNVTIHENVKPDISLYVYPDSSICAHSSVTFYTYYNGEGNFPIFIWKKNGVTISGVTGDYYDTDSITNNDTVTCILNNGCQSDTSNAIIMSVADSASSPSVTITASPSDTITAGSYVTFNATVTLGGNSPFYQWRVNGANAGNNSPSFTIGTLGNNDVVTCILTSDATCLDGQKDTSNPIVMVVNYCTPTSYYSCYYDIITSKVVFNTINRPSSCDGSNGYSYHSTAPNVTTVHKGNSYVLAVTTGSSYDEGVAAWIDYNHNNVFESSETVLSGYTGNVPETYVASVPIPATAIQGPTRLRVRSVYGYNPVSNSCGDDYFGETEDYLITIDTSSCTPPALTITGDTTGRDSVKLTASGGVSYIWSGGTTPYQPLNTFYASGTYGVQATNGAGCSSAQIINVDVVAPLSCVTEIFPQNGTAHVSITGTLQWTASSGKPLGYHIYLGTDSLNLDLVSTQAETSYTYSLSVNTKYFWKVVPYNSSDTLTSCTIWSFTTRDNPPECAGIVAPADNATDVSLDATLSWISGGGAPTGYLVKLGKSPTNLAVYGTTGTSFQTNLDPNSTYYWQAIPTNVNGSPSNCPVWSFKTITCTQPAITANASTTLCTDQTVILTASDGLSYNWNTGATTKSITTGLSGHYYAFVDQGNRCNQKTNTITVMHDNAPFINSGNINSVCPGDSLKISYNLPSPLWNTGETTSSIIVHPAATTTYYAEGTSAAGCFYKDSLKITVNPAFQPSPVTNMIPDDNTINLSVPFNLSWLPGIYSTKYDLYIWPDSTSQPATPTISNLSSINYTLTNSDINAGETYKWRIVSKNGDCFSTSGSIQTFSTKNLPDLIVDSITVPSIVATGQPISIAWQVKNISDGSTGSTDWLDHIWLSADTILQDNPPATDFYLGGVPNPTALLAGESYNNSATFIVPHDIGGSYHVMIKTNQLGTQSPISSVEEKNDTNNLIVSRPLQINLTPSPDLQVTSIITPINAFSGLTVNVNWTVTNKGNDIVSSSPAWIDKVYISFSPIFSTQTAILLNQVTHTGNLLKDSSYTAFAAITIPSYISGLYSIYVQTDAVDQVYEVPFESNNISSDVINVYLTPPPDLSVQNFNAPLTASSGSPVSLSWTVKNVGPSPTDNYWVDKVYISKNGNYDLSDAIELTAEGSPGVLVSGNSYNHQANAVIPNNFNGKYYFYINTNATNSLFEYTNEQNNILRSDTSVQINSPDLIVEKVSLPATANSGETITVSWNVKNQGNGDIFNANRIDSIYLSAQPSFSYNTATSLGKATFNESISKSNSLTKQTSVRLPNGITGNYYVYIITDAGKTIYENGFENNNTGRSTEQINVALSPWPDLIVQNRTFPDSSLSGLKIPVSFTIKNAGHTSAIGSAWTDEIYLSYSRIWDKNKSILLGSFNRTQSLDSNDSYVISDSLLLGVSSIGQVEVKGHLLDSSFAYIYVFSDGQNQIYEYTSENNNISATDSVYIIPPRIDLEVTDVYSSDSAYSGQSANVYWTVRNNGISTAYKGVQVPCYWYDGVYLSKDTIWDASDIFVFDWGYSNTPHDSSYSDNKNFIVPNGLSGDYYLLLVADHKHNLHEEVNFSNNYRLIRDEEDGDLELFHIILSPSPDLVLTRETAPATQAAGQPVTVTWTTRNDGAGNTSVSGWQDGIFLSKDLNLDRGDLLIGSKAHTGNLQPGQQYNDTLDAFLPADASGNYVLIVATDFHDNVFEYQSENNNAKYSFITVTVPPPSDLIVSSIYPPDSAIAGEPVNISYTIKNNGSNPATGVMTDGIYLSRDSIWDVSDPLVSTLTGTVNLAPNGQITRNVSAQLTGVSAGNYKVIVKTDLLNNILETNDANNNAVSGDSMSITVKQLFLNVLTPDTLKNDNYLYYRIEIPDSLKKETLLISLKSDSLSASNELYVKLGEVPSRAVNDYNYGTVPGPRQEVLIPSLQSGTYYVAAYGKNTTADKQKIDLYASILPFAIRTVQANKGGNTGSVTVQIDGSKFEANMKISLEKGGESIQAISTSYVNSTKLYATFNLRDRALGVYNVVAKKTDNSLATLTNGFEIVTGSGGGFYVNGTGTAEPGCDPDAANGLNSLIQVALQYPSATRRNRVIAITIFYGNSGNVDLPVPTRFVYSTGGAPLSFSVDGLTENLQELYLEFKETNGPPNILRPGATGSITIYTKAVAPLTFLLSN